MPLKIADSFIINIPPDILKKTPRLKSLSKQLSMKYVYKKVVTENDLKIVGGQLWNGLNMGDELDNARNRALPDILPVIL